MPRRDPVSIFWGPHRGFEDLAQWPPTIQLHLQLFGLQPGSEAIPPLPSQLFDPHILPPTATPGTWALIVFPIGYLFTHTPTLRLLSVLDIVTRFEVFAFTVPYALNNWAYNLLTDPAGNLAFGGSATLSWKEP